MQITTTLEDVQYAASICLKCGCCTYGDWPENYHLCSLFYRDECFTHGGGGFMSIVTALAENLLEFDGRIAELAYTCAGCMVCDTRCSIIKAHPPQVHMLDMIRLLRYEAVKRGFIPEGVVGRIYDEIRETGDLKTKNILKLPDDISDNTAEMVFFDECTHSQASESILNALTELLTKIGMPVDRFHETGCCGSSLYDYGFWDQLIPLMESNRKGMKELKGRKLVFTNPHCQEFVVKRYPEILPDYKVLDHVHISGFILDALKKGKISSKKKEGIRVSYHDPCYLGRGLGIYEEPREVLSSLEGVEMVEMKRNRQNAYCCGARAIGNYFSNPAEETAKERIGEFNDTGAQVLITACPYCKENFRKVLPEDKKDSVVDLIEFVNDRV